MMPINQQETKRYLPSNWDDDVRMNALFTDFRNRNVNPNDWIAKMHFWKPLILEYSAKTSKMTFTVANLRNAFSRHGRTPRGLKTVTEDMISEGQLMTLSSFMKFTSEPGWLSWSWDILVKRPLSFTWSFISNSLFQPPDEEQVTFVNMDMLREKATLILENHQNRVENGDEDNTIALDVLAKQCKSICSSEKDLELCLLYLRKEKKLSLHMENQHKIVKFVNNGQRQPAQLSQMEKALVQLRMVKQTLENQIGAHEADIERHIAEAKSQLKMGARHLAKASLQKKKQAEKLLSKKEKTLENIEMLLHRLQDVGTQKAVLDALQAGSDAFKFDQNASHLDLDRVDETMAAVQESLDMQEDIQETLARSVQPRLDESELEKELEDILSDAGSPTETRRESLSDSLEKRLHQLRMEELPEFPEPPTHEPFDDEATAWQKGKSVIRE